MAYAVAFDTLAYAKKLESCGISAKQAEGQAEALANVLEVNFLSKKDAEIEYEKSSNKLDLIDRKIDNLENKIDQKIDNLESKMDQKMDMLKVHMQQDNAHIKIDIIKWVIGVGFAQIALTLSVLKFLH